MTNRGASFSNSTTPNAFDIPRFAMMSASEFVMPSEVHIERNDLHIGSFEMSRAEIFVVASAASAPAFSVHACLLFATQAIYPASLMTVRSKQEFTTIKSAHSRFIFEAIDRSLLAGMLVRLLIVSCHERRGLLIMTTSIVILDNILSWWASMDIQMVSKSQIPSAYVRQDPNL